MASPVPSPRLVSLDVLRGLAILLMIFSGMLPKTLPNWVDHGYQPHYRPDASGVWTSALRGGDAVFDPRWKAFTWVDLVFPMFLFAMGAAIPLAMSGRLARGQTTGQAVRTIVGRAFALIVFAVIVTQMTAWQLDWPNADVKRLLVMIGLVGVFAFYWRAPATMPVVRQRAIRFGGLALIVALIGASLAKTGGKFGWDESDTIILVLAHCYLIAALLWLATRRWGWWRLATIAPLLLLAHYLQLNAKSFGDWLWLGEWPLSLGAIAQAPGRWLNLSVWLPATSPAWLTRLLNLSPLWNFTWYKFLWVVVPGTIVGDWIVGWSKRDERAEPLLRRSPVRLICGLTIAISVAVFAGLRHYGYPLAGIGGPLRTPWLALTLAVPLLACLVIAARPILASDSLQRRLLVGGVAILLLGLALACLPNASAREGFFEGGISKGSPASLSYYATTVGLCMLLLMGFIGILDADERMRRGPGFIEANGQNPLLAYYLAHAVLGAALTFGVFAWIGSPLGPNIRTLEDLVGVPLADHPWIYAIWSAAKTLIIAAIVWALTRRRIFWRA